MRSPIVRSITVMVLVAVLLSACGQPATPVKVVSPTNPAPTAAASTSPAASSDKCALTLATAKGVTGKYPQQFDIAEYEKLTGCKLQLKQNPLFDEDVKAGKLPPIDQRLPSEPLVVEPYEAIGKYGGTLRGLSLGPSSGTTEFFSFRLATLVRLSDDLRAVVPNVAKSWTANSDFTQWTFVLRKGHKWSDGKPFTADDIVFWYEDYILNKELNPTTPSLWVRNGTPAKVEKIDEVTVKFTFAAPAPGLLIALATTANEPWAPKHAVQQYHIKYNADANELAKKANFRSWVELFSAYFNKWPDLMDRPEVPTLDSHMLKEAPNTERRIRVANPYYFKVDTAGQQLPYINIHQEDFVKDKELINLKILNGEVDMKSQSLDLASYPLYKENEGKGNYSLQLPAGFGGMIYAFNPTHKDPVLAAIFRDVRFKQAMSLAINRDEINKLLYFGKAVPSQAIPSPKLSFIEPWMASHMAAYDPAKASALLDEMGLKKGADGKRLRPDGKPLIILMEYSQQAENVKNNELVKEYWEAVGVQVQLKELTSDALRARSTTNDLDIGVWSYTLYYQPNMVSDPMRLYPAFGDGLLYMAGLPWLKWSQTNGKEGEEPPADVKQLFDLVAKWQMLEPESPAWVEAGKAIMKINLDNLFLIGTVGEVPGPTVVSNRLGNTPQWSAQSSDFQRALPFRGDQWYFKN